MLLSYCVVLLAVLAANVGAIIVVATVARRRMHHDKTNLVGRATRARSGPCRSRSGFLFGLFSYSLSHRSRTLVRPLASMLFLAQP